MDVCCALYYYLLLYDSDACSFRKKGKEVYKNFTWYMFMLHLQSGS
jgi:hypothetical protein